LRKILDDPEASDNDRFVRLRLLKNANIAAGKVLPMCQDTGTSIVMAKKGERIWTGGGDAAAIAAGSARPSPRPSSLQPSGAALHVRGGQHRRPTCRRRSISTPTRAMISFLFVSKGGGSANKTFLYQQTKAVLNPKSLIKFSMRRSAPSGPPRARPITSRSSLAHLGGADLEDGEAREHQVSRRPAERRQQYGQASATTTSSKEVLDLTRQMGIGAQFGGKYFCHDVRVIRLTRTAPALHRPRRLVLADRQILGKIHRRGRNFSRSSSQSAKYLPDVDQAALAARS